MIITIIIIIIVTIIVIIKVIIIKHKQNSEANSLKKHFSFLNFF